jgi:transposase-like protein
VPAERHDRKFWEQACREVERGGSVGEVARRLEVRPRTLSWWRWNLGRKKSTVKRERGAEFLPVVLADSRALRGAAAPIEIDAGGVMVRVEPGTDVEYIAALVFAIRAGC